MTLEERDGIEGRYTRLRWLELQRRPVNGFFDAVHLREINCRIFQGVPRIPGFEHVTPGDYRPPASNGLDWQKNRTLSTINGSFYVAYSRVDEAARARLDQVLEGAVPEALRSLKTDAFTQRLGPLYAELDHVHPFQDGNSRTLRAFTGQLARRAGYEID
jgi:cell filamentation protein